MSRRLHRSELTIAVRELLTEEISAAAHNMWMSHEEVRRADPLVRREDAALRAEGGPGTRVRTSDLIERSIAAVLAAWDAVDPPGPGVDAALLSRAEIRAILARAPEAGVVLVRAVERLATGSATSVEAVREALGALDLTERVLDDGTVPGAVGLDPRKGQPDRARVPEAVLAGFDAWYRVEAADFGSAKLYRCTVAGQAAWVAYTTTDGDDSWLEVWTEAGAPLASSRWYAGRIVAWDEFFGRARLVPTFLEFGTVSEEGLSEPGDRAAAGQVPFDWTGDVQITSGSIAHAGGQLTTITLPVELGSALRELAWAALTLLWDRTFRHRASGAAIELGLPRGAGELRIGSFTRSTTGVTYETALWRDIDDASFTLYFRRGEHGLELAIEQFDN